MAHFTNKTKEARDSTLADILQVEAIKMGVLESGKGIYGIGHKGKKGKHFSISQHITEHLG